MRATVKDRPDGVEYAAGKALFVIPKKHPLNTSADGGAEEDRAHAAGKYGVQHGIHVQEDVGVIMLMHGWQIAQLLFAYALCAQNQQW